MKDYLTIAKIVKPQGIRGELKVVTMTDTPADLCSFDRVYVGGNEYKLLKVRPQPGDCAFITLSQIADRNAAELLRGMDVEALRADAPALPEGTYYIADLIGCKVFTKEGSELGAITRITPARTDVYELEGGGRTYAFAAVEGVITDVDLSARKVIVDGEKYKTVVVEE